jgi:hypothetical protein
MGRTRSVIGRMGCKIPTGYSSCRGLQSASTPQIDCSRGSGFPYASPFETLRGEAASASRGVDSVRSNRAESIRPPQRRAQPWSQPVMRAERSGVSTAFSDRIVVVRALGRSGDSPTLFSLFDSAEATGKRFAFQMQRGAFFMVQTNAAGSPPTAQMSRGVGLPFYGHRADRAGRDSLGQRRLSCSFDRFEPSTDRTSTPTVRC